MDSNYLVRATALDGKVRAFALNATTVVRELQDRHGLYPVPSAAVGRTAMGALLLAAASLKKENQLLTIEIRGGGPIGRILCTANGAGEVRGLATNPTADAESISPGKLNVAGVVGREGYVSVSKDLGMRDTYQGTVEIVSGEIAEDIAFYLGRSEQVPSAIGLGVFVTADGLVDAAGGYLIQLLPGLQDDEIAIIERKVAELPHPTTLIKEGVSPEALLDRVFEGDVQVLDSYPVRFGCPCSRERFQAALVTLGSEEMTRIIEEEENEVTELVCHFCNQAYHFTREDMAEILRAAS